MKEQFNKFTGHKYQGQNALDLASKGFDSNQWGTYHQWLNAGMQVQKGQHGTGVMLVKPSEDDKGKAVVRWYKVFNLEQVAPVVPEAPVTE